MTKGGSHSGGWQHAHCRGHTWHGHMHRHIKVEFNTHWDGNVYRIITVLGRIVTPCDMRLWDYIIQEISGACDADWWKLNHHKSSKL